MPINFQGGSGQGAAKWRQGTVQRLWRHPADHPGCDDAAHEPGSALEDCDVVADTRRDPHAIERRAGRYSRFHGSEHRHPTSFFAPDAFGVDARNLRRRTNRACRGSVSAGARAISAWWVQQAERGKSSVTRFTANRVGRLVACAADGFHGHASLKCRCRPVGANRRAVHCSTARAAAAAIAWSDGRHDPVRSTAPIAADGCTGIGYSAAPRDQSIPA